MKKLFILLASTIILTACGAGSSSSTTIVEPPVPTATLTLTATPQTCNLSNNSTVSFDLSGLTPGVSYMYFEKEGTSHIHIGDTFTASSTTQNTSLTCDQISRDGSTGLHSVIVFKSTDGTVFTVDDTVFSNTVQVLVTNIDIPANEESSSN